MVAAGLLGPVFALAEASWGDPNWEVPFFGQVSATLALPMLGLGILAFAGAQSGSWRQLSIVAVVCAILAVVSLAGTALVGLNVPLALVAARNAGSYEQATGLKILTAKALLLCGLYGFGGMFLSLKLFGAALHIRRSTI